MSTITAQAEVTRVDGRSIDFNVSARDDSKEIGNGIQSVW